MDQFKIKDILQKPYDRTQWVGVLNFLSGNKKGLSINLEPEEIRLTTQKQQAVVKRILKLGVLKTSDNVDLPIFEIELQKKVKIEYNRVAVNDIIKAHILKDAGKGALATYYYDDSERSEWRFSFISKHAASEFFDEADNLETNPKKYTYIFGTKEQHRTAIERIFNLKQSSLYLEDFFEAFNVEPVSKNFFKEYKSFYLDFVQHLSTDESNRKIFDHGGSREDVERDIRNFVKRFMGRIIFLYFLQKKRWLGATTTAYEDGDVNFLENLFKEEYGRIDRDQFYRDWLSPLFFKALNTPDRADDGFTLPNGGSLCIPFLNGGLFEADHEPKGHEDITLLATHIGELFTFLNGYNFTIYENSPDDHTLAVDPEMLGHIFENLLEDNKDKGAFYTPKEIVQYMTQESLIEYLQTKAECDREIIEILVKKHERKESSVSNEMLEEIDQYLDQLKACDPAIGSGAFPMGLLQEVFSLKTLIHYELHADEPLLAAQIKQNIIQNSIYGVDIEEGAVDIARLRFWLSLVVDEPTPKPLPNLDYKIIVGNSLLSRYALDVPIDNVFIEFNKRVRNGELNDPEIQALIEGRPLNLEGYKKLVNDYLAESNPEQKALFKRLIGQIKKSFKTLMAEREMTKLATARGEVFNLQQKDMFGNTVGTKEQLTKAKGKLSVLEAERDAIVNNKNFEGAVEWRFEFPHLLDDNGAYLGFDITIGNPPYIQLQNNSGALAEQLAPMNFETFVRTGDIYALFYEKGNQLLKDNGVLSYITSSQWMKASYGKKLRKYFSDFNPIRVIDLGPNVFHTATVHSNILLLKKEANTDELLGGHVSSTVKIETLSERDLAPLLSVNEGIWTILTPVENDILKTVQELGKQLYHWKVEINRGVLTGYNEAFIIDQKKRDALVAKDAKNTEIIKPVLKGREIERYFVEKNNEYLISTLPSLKLDIDDYPYVKKYFEGFLPKLKQSGETFRNSDGVMEKTRKKTGNRWFETQDQISFYQDFRKERVIWKRIGSIMRFAYSNEEMFSLDSTCIATGEKIKYLTALLNSKLMLYYLHKTSPKTGTGDCIISVQALNPLPVYYPSANAERLFVSLFELIMLFRSAKDNIIEQQKNKHVHEFFEEVVDGCVFELYFKKHMEEKEIAIISLVEDALAQSFGNINNLEELDLEKEKERVWTFYKTLKDGEVQKRIRNFVSKSPNILKPVIQYK